MATGCTTGRYTGTPFNLNLKDLDLKDFFRLISDISGLNVVLDPSVKGSLTIVLNDVPWDQALAIVLNNNGLECQLQGNVLRIATIETLRTEAEARRAQQEAQSLAVPKQTFTRYLSYAHSKDLVAVIKRFLSPRGDVVSDDRSNALIIEDIPGTLPKIDALLTALDRKTPEVEIEARIVAATRSFARDIGTQLGFGWGNSVTATGGGSGANSPITVTQPPGRNAQLHHRSGQQLSHSAVFEPGGIGPDQRFLTGQLLFHLSSGLCPDYGGKQRLAEDIVPSARRDAEQYHRAGETGFQNPGSHAGPVGWTANRNLR